jgi:hypothetical protein
MTSFKLFGVAAILSTAIATPGIAQQAVQEPGLRASTRAWVLDPAQAGQLAASHLYAAAALMRARWRNIMRARHRSITPALTSGERIENQLDAMRQS